MLRVLALAVLNRWPVTILATQGGHQGIHTIVAGSLYEDEVLEELGLRK